MKSPTLKISPDSTYVFIYRSIHDYDDDDDDDDDDDFHNA